MKIEILKSAEGNEQKKGKGQTSKSQIPKIQVVPHAKKIIKQGKKQP